MERKKKIIIVVAFILGLGIIIGFSIKPINYVLINDVGGIDVKISQYETTTGILDDSKDYNAFPKAIITDKIENSGFNRTIACWYNGDNHVDSNDDGIIMMSYSNDEGLTWSIPDIVYDDPVYDCRNIGLIKAPNGTIIIFFAKIDGYSDNTWGDYKHLWVDFGFILSYDHGVTWNEYISLIHEPEYAAAGIVTGNGYSDLALLGNDMYVMCYGYPELSYDETHCGFMLKSTDNGNSWDIISTLSLNTGISTSESDILSDLTNSQKIWGITRTQNTEKRLMYYFESNDAGNTWENLSNLNIEGDCPDLIRLSDGRTLLAFRYWNTFNNFIGYTIFPADFDEKNIMEKRELLQNVEPKCLIKTTYGEGNSNIAYTSIHEITNNRILVVYYDIEKGGVFSRIIEASFL